MHFAISGGIPYATCSESEGMADIRANPTVTREQCEAAFEMKGDHELVLAWRGWIERIWARYPNPLAVSMLLREFLGLMHLETESMHSVPPQNIDYWGLALE
jgi:hypothetical protein